MAAGRRKVTDCHTSAAALVRNDKKNEITVVGFLIREDGSRVPMEEITPEEREAWETACCQRLSQRMSDYYTQHPEEWAKL